MWGAAEPDLLPPLVRHAPQEVLLQPPAHVAISESCSQIERCGDDRIDHRAFLLQERSLWADNSVGNSDVIGNPLQDSGTITLQKCAAVPRRARIQGS